MVRLLALSVLVATIAITPSPARAGGFDLGTCIQRARDACLAAALPAAPPDEFFEARQQTEHRNDAGYCRRAAIEVCLARAEAKGAKFERAPTK
jgi:hypothetical protein